MTAPMPPADLAWRVIRNARVSETTEFYRFFNNQYDPTYFNRSNSGRWNAPNGEYGTLYLGTLRGAFAETFLRAPAEDVIAADELKSRGLAKYSLPTGFHVIPMFGPHLPKMGATAEVCHGGHPYNAPQAWSRAIWQTCQEEGMPAAGVQYTSRHDDQEYCIAVFELAAEWMRTEVLHKSLTGDDVADLLEYYEVGLAPGW